MNPDNPELQQLIREAYHAMHSGDLLTARRYAERCVTLAPDQEEPWLLLASVSGPKASVAYIEHALAINPKSPRALAGLRWAQQRLQSQPGELKTTTRPEMPAERRVTPALQVEKPRQPLAPIQAEDKPEIQGTPLTPVQQTEEEPMPPGPEEPLEEPIATLKASLDKAEASRLAQPVKRSTPPANLIKALMIIIPATLLGAALLATAVVFISKRNGFSSPWQALVYALTSSFKGTGVPGQNANSQTDLHAILTESARNGNAAQESNPKTVATEKPYARASANDFYTIKAGDTYPGIAKKLGIHLRELINLNGISDPSTIQPGQELVLPNPDEVAPIQTSPHDVKRILVDLSDQHLYAYQGNELIYDYVVSTGRNDSTQVGSFSILEKVPDPYSYTWNFWMPYWMGIYWEGSLENGIHSLPVLEDGRQIWGDSLGTPVSAGCVVLAPDDAKQLYQWARVGTAVEIKR